MTALPVRKLIRITTVPMSLQYLLRGQLSFMKQQGFEVLAVSADGRERDQIIAEGIDHVIIPFTRKITPLQDLLCLVKLIRLFRAVKPDIVHTHTPKAGLLGMMAARFCGVKVRLHTVAGLPLMEARGLKQRILKMTEWMTYACATKVYPNARGLWTYIQSQFNIRQSKFAMIGNGSSNGIDSQYFNRTPELEAQARLIREKYSIRPQEIGFCFIGRVVRDKGIVELTQAFQDVVKNHPARLLIVGPLEQDLDPLPELVLHFLQTSPNVIMPGFQPDVRPWLMAGDVFVFPSYREGFPNVVMQACCLEVPCIVSDINGCNEIIQHNETGIIIPVKETEALKDAMLALMEDAALRKTFAHRARTFVAASLDQQVIWTEWSKEYRKCLINCDDTN
jgi:glycosyltransferase involved in cell wall biosynthesis